MYMIKVGHKVLNETLVFSQDSMVPESWQNHLDLAFENAYVYGRDFLSKMVREFSTNAVHVCHQRSVKTNALRTD
jgi:hypothetical protein